LLKLRNQRLLRNPINGENGVTTLFAMHRCELFKR
jgi:hypothetical protein